MGTSPGSIPENELFIYMCDVDLGATLDYCEFLTNELQAGQTSSSSDIFHRLTNGGCSIASLKESATGWTFQKPFSHRQVAFFMPGVA